MYNFIVNPHSRSGHGKEIWQQIEPILKKEHVQYTVYFTQYQKHATHIVRELTSDLDEHIIIVLGGDGTVNEAVNGITDFEKAILGYIPTGSSNDFSRSLQLPTEPAAALDTILHSGKTRPIDVGILKYGTKQRNFAVSTGLGFDAAICHQAVVSKIKGLLNKLKLGKLTYVMIALHRLLLDQTVRLTVTVDDQEPQTFDKVYFVSVMNNLYEGGGFMMCPKACPDDGLLDAIVVSELPKWKIFFLLTTAYSGRHVRIKGVYLFQGKRIRIDSEKALPVHTDGEPIFLQNHIETLPAPKQLRIITQ